MKPSSLQQINIKSLKFDTSKNVDFANDLRKRVNEYFAQTGISKYGNFELYFKTSIAFVCFLLPYYLMVSGNVASIGLMYVLWILMGIATATIGTCVMHDSIHGSFSQLPWFNKLMGNTMNLIGGNAYVWKMQHNVLHHTYTNVNQVDDDIDIPYLLRMSPHQPKHSFHRFQHVYVWVLYFFSTIFWITTKDFVQLYKYKQRGLLKDNREYFGRLFNIIIWKIIYFGYLLVVPILFIEAPIFHIISMFLTMHLVAGILLSIIFQPAHVFPETTFTPETVKRFENNYVVHQFLTTTNFTLKDPFFSNIAGGLNYQIEHHLFPNISHVHYRKISPIVAACAKDYGIPYFNENSLWDALKGHAEALKKMGNNELVPSIS